MKHHICFRFCVFILTCSVIFGINTNTCLAETFDVRVSQSEDDAEQRLDNGVMNLSSTDMELGNDHSVAQAVGLRFQNVSIPQGATIVSAHLEFETDETSSTTTNVTIKGQDTDDAAAFTTTAYDLTNRTRTSAGVSWSIPVWNTLDETHQSQNISAVVQEIVDRTGWAPNNNMVFIIGGTGGRIAEAYDGEPEAAPLLHVEYTTTASFRKTPYLIFPGVNTQMVVLWQADRAVTTNLIEWGQTIGYGNDASPSEYGDDHQFALTITGLSPETQYYYRVTVDESTETGYFRTAPADTTTDLTFYAYGDSQLSPPPDDHNDILTALLSDIDANPVSRQTLLLKVGDWTQLNTEEEWDETFFYGPGTEALVSRLPVMGCRGNHEAGIYMGPEGGRYIKYYPYNNYMPNLASPAPGPNDYYYSFDYGPLHVSVVDSNEVRTPGSAQYLWLQNDLKNTDKPWKIVMFHHPAWGASITETIPGEGDDITPHYNSMDNQVLSEELIHPAGVSLVLNGHNHYYMRCLIPSGSRGVPDEGEVHHITTGGGGSRGYDPDTGFEYYVESAQCYHFIRFDITGNTLIATVHILGEIDSETMDPDCDQIGNFTFTIRIPEGNVNSILPAVFLLLL